LFVYTYIDDKSFILDDKFDICMIYGM